MLSSFLVVRHDGDSPVDFGADGMPSHALWMVGALAKIVTEGFSTH